MGNKKEVFKKTSSLFLIVNTIIAILSFCYLINATNLPVATMPTGSAQEVFKSGEYYNVKFGSGEAIARVTKIESGMVSGTLSDGTIVSWKEGDAVSSTVQKFQNNYWGSLEYGKNINPSSYEKLGIKSVENINDKTIITKTDGTRVIYGADGNLISGNAGVGWWQGAQNFFTLNNLISAAAIGGLGALIGGFAGGKNGALWGFVSGFSGTMAYNIAQSAVGPGKAVFNIFGLKITPSLFGIGVAAAIFILTYKKTSTEIVEFNCQPWEAPIGGADCEKCNEIENGCSEYRCKSLGQACGIVNAGTTDEKCVWINPHDVNSPLIKIGSLLKGYTWKPDNAVRPPATGVVISKEDGSCIEAFTPLEFTIATDEASQCKINYNLTKGFDEMNYYVGGTNIFSYNHTETMSLPGPDAINKIAPELKNDGTYTLYVRCQDANGNFNQDAFSVRFCVKPGPDTTPPRIEAVNIPSKSPIQYNTTILAIEVYVNEPSECKWSREDRTFDNMENTMICSTNLWEMNNNNVYTCKTTLTGIKDRTENDFYFRCKDQPNAEEKDRNVNTQSYKYTIYGTQPLNILSVGPNETIRGSTDTVPVELTVKTDNGYKNGEAICYYSTTGNEKDYIQFLETGTNEHKQRQDLVTGSYKYYFKCVDLGGNAAYDSTTFSVEVDRSSPTVVRAYKEGGLKIITSEKSICSYSNKDCNFEIKDGIQMPYDNEEIHTAEWKSQNYYIRCKDEYDNQPNPNTCSIVVKPYNLGENVVEL